MPRKKKQQSRRAVRVSKAGMKALAAAGAIAAGTQAYAAPIRFENPDNQWDWQLGSYHGTPSPNQFLDITLDAASQGDTVLDSVNFKQIVYYDYPYTTALYSYADFMTQGYFALGIGAGTLVGQPGQTFYGLGNIAAESYYYYGVDSLIPEGVQTYLGARIRIDSQYHYGWIGVVRDGFELDAFAWGYESDAGVPIPAGIPEPNTLALLALGFCAATRRR